MNKSKKIINLIENIHKIKELKKNFLQKKLIKKKHVKKLKKIQKNQKTRKMPRTLWVRRKRKAK